MTDDPQPRVFRDRPVSFVRRSGRMSEAQERAWERSAGRFAIPVERDVASTSVAPGTVVDPEAVYGRAAPLIVEIGSGQGHAIMAAAASRPDDDFLAVEVFAAGLARTVLDAERLGLTNLRVVEANDPEVLEHLLPPRSVAELWVFFPDPWHKSKHVKRRLVTDAFAGLAERVVAAGGMLRLATDWQPYADQMRDVLDRAPGFDRAFKGAWSERFDGRIETAFERKGRRAGRSIRDLAYVRRTA